MNPLVTKAGQDLQGLADRLQRLGAAGNATSLLDEVRTLQRRLGQPGADISALLAEVKQLQERTDTLELSLRRTPTVKGGTTAPR